MKTYYFSCYWEDPWECGDGCCTGGGEWVINFVKMVDEQGNISDECSRNFGTSWSTTQALQQVYELECDKHVPDFVYNMSLEEADMWVEAELFKKSVVVAFEMNEK